MQKSEQQAIGKLKTALTDLQEEHRLLEDKVMHLSKALKESKEKLQTVDAAIEDVKVM